MNFLVVSVNVSGLPVKEMGLTYLFIAHDLAMVKHISDRIGVMYLGNLVEVTTSDALYAKPLHPYTQSLLSAIPIPDPEIERTRERIILQGDVPSPLNPPSGCPFRTRCPQAMPQCAESMPPSKEVEPNHFVACHLY
jgi:oligopeptide transport system ATP-binding protein